MSLQALTSKSKRPKERFICCATTEKVTNGRYSQVFMATSLFARPSIEFITIGPEVIHRAEELTESCEHCHPGDAEIPFDWLLAEVVGKHGPFEFILAEPARCPNCKHEITEKTLTAQAWS